MSEASDLLAVIRSIVEVLDRRGIRDFVTGSFASSVHGEFRATNDIDLVADLDEHYLRHWAAWLGVGDLLERVLVQP